MEYLLLVIPFTLFSKLTNTIKRFHSLIQVIVLLAIILSSSLQVFSIRNPHQMGPLFHPMVEELPAFTRNTSIQASDVLPIGNKVLFQAYYWEPNNVMVPDNGAWWKGLQSLIPELARNGFDSLWLPPPQKTNLDNIASMGYEPYDYYDLGKYNQKGRVRTRYGTQEDLQSLIALANQYGLAAIADIVINHNNGGEDEFNPFVGHYTPTNFMNIASGLFPRNYTHFWPNPDYGTNDSLAFGTFPDLIHAHPYVHEELIKWGKWLRDVIGYDGWRFDVAAGIIPEMLRDWMNSIGGWGVAEYWIIHDKSLPLYTYEKQVKYLDGTNNTVNAFDFELRLNLREMTNLNGDYNMSLLDKYGLLWNGREQQAVTVVANHDTGRDARISITQNKHLAYAYILTHGGYPSVYWYDYFDFELGPHIKNLVAIHNALAKGTTSVLFSDKDLYVAQRNGEPGLVVGINDNPTEWKQAIITTKWKNTLLNDYTLQAEPLHTNENGETTIRVPPNSYVVYSTGTPFITNPLPPPYLNESSFVTPDYLPTGNITLDGIFSEEWWGKLMFIDPYGDASRYQKDFSRLYLTQDDENLYLGVKYGTNIAQEPLQLGIAISVKPGGASTIPGHNEIKFLGGSQLPEYLYFFNGNEKDPWINFDEVVKYKYLEDAENWDSGTLIDPSRYENNPMIGFLEFKIPLKEIDLSSGSYFNIKVFSTAKNRVAAYDSIPGDYSIGGDGNETSWIKLSDFIFLEKSPTTTPSPTTPTTIPTTTIGTNTNSSINPNTRFISHLMKILKQSQEEREERTLPFWLLPVLIVISIAIVIGRRKYLAE